MSPASRPAGPRGFLTEEEKRLLHYFSYAAASVTHKWKVDGMQETPEQMAGIITEITPKFVLELLNR